MEKLISRIGETAGIDPAQADKAVGMILGFLQREADQSAVATMIERIPGAAGSVARHNGEDAGTGSGVMGLGQALMGEGLDMNQIDVVARETMAFAKEQAGEDTVDTVVASVPGLSQFV